MGKRRPLAYLVAHACYKGSLFLLAGVIDHETGTRDITRLSGLRRVMPISAAAGALAAASMAGLPPLLGFLAKEQSYTAVLAYPSVPLVLAAVLVVSSALLGTAGLLAGVAPFLGKDARGPGAPHEASPGLWASPLLLAALGVAGALASLAGPVLGLAVSSVRGRPVALGLSLWHGWSLPLSLSAVTIKVICSSLTV